MKAKRAASDPARFNLPVHRRRRVAGLRREEVALLAGISVTWYTQIESGADITISPALLGRLADVFSLTPLERAYLFTLGIDEMGVINAVAPELHVLCGTRIAADSFSDEIALVRRAHRTIKAQIYSTILHGTLEALRPHLDEERCPIGIWLHDDLACDHRRSNHYTLAARAHGTFHREIENVVGPVSRAMSDARSSYSSRRAVTHSRPSNSRKRSRGGLRAQPRSSSRAACVAREPPRVGPKSSRKCRRNRKSATMFPAPVGPFVPPQFGIKAVTEAWELDAYFGLRRDVFCTEQRMFERDDRDVLDDVAEAIVAVDYVMGMADRVVGTVRIVEAQGGIWYGSRLAIGHDYRGVYGLASGLVYRAVSAAHARGATEFLATVQRGNVGFFRRLAWEALEEISVYGHPHTLMRADLAAYPPLEDPSGVALVSVRRAS